MTDDSQLQEEALDAWNEWWEATWTKERHQTMCDAFVEGFIRGRNQRGEV